MKALVYINKETLSYREETNLIPNSDENLIRVNASGICGSDMHAYHGLDERRVPPLILGHEISGFDTSNKSPVVINPLITCKKCENCLIGREHICINRGLLALVDRYERPSHNSAISPRSLISYGRKI